MIHEAYDVLISAQLDGDLSPEEEARLEEHLAQCPDCRRARQELSAVHTLLAGTAVQAPPGLTETILAGLAPQTPAARISPWKRRVAPVAVAAVVALVAIGVVKPQLPTGNGDSAAAEEYALVTEGAAEETEEAIPTPEAEEAEAAPAEASLPSEAPSQGETADQKAESSVSSSHSQTSGPAAGRPSGQTSAQGGGQSAKPAQTAVPPQPGPTPAQSSGSLPAETEAQTFSRETAEPDQPQASLSEEALYDHDLPLSEPAEAPESPMAPQVSEPLEQSASIETEEAAGGGGGDPVTEESAPSYTSFESADTEQSPLSQASSTISWQQAKNILADYLGTLPDDFAAQGMNSDGTAWLFTAGGTRYAVDRTSGAVSVVGGG